MNLQEQLDDVTVGEVDEYHAEVNPGVTGLRGWFFVTTGDEGVVGYFLRERYALHARLAIINARLNKIGE